MAKNVKRFTRVQMLFHFALILFWLYDRSPDQQATKDLLGFTCNALTLIRPVLILPFVSQEMAHLAGIMERVFLGKPT